ncbi:YdcF family protein [Aliterella atlantica]|uniref:Rhodanese domain-containing protein n=1 Tax=Aliterella atlantica CENA595 TaxID=1618023 RepID=A0A0D8ZVN0_9CYAN|nr:hypothetical protein UH38_13390 [Aliterella atlantica CENA595]
MFLYLSKLLPLFIYPLGFTCVLLVVALVMLWKKSRWVAIPVVAALLTLLLTSNGWTALAMVRSLEWQNIPSQLPSAEAIVVLGGSTKAGFPPRPGVDLSEEGDRVLYGATLYRQGLAPLIIVSGGRIEWKGSGPPEAEDMTEILTQIGVPRSAIVQEPNSYNTHDNAVNVKKILQQRGINRILLVTSAMHMPRSLAIFKRQKIDAVAAPTDFLISSNEIQEIQGTVEARLLNLLPDSSHLQNFTRALKEYVGLLIYKLRGWA